jgi:hypothetical protein
LNEARQDVAAITASREFWRRTVGWRARDLLDPPHGEAIRRNASLSLNNGQRRKLSKIGAVKVFRPRAI